MDGDNAEIRIRWLGSVVSVTLSAPARRNALSRAMVDSLAAAVTDALEADATALVIAGEGEVFSAGADLRELTGTLADREVDAGIASAVAVLRSAPVPAIAAIEGACVGAAVDLASACDVRVAGAGASFQVPAVSLALLYSPKAIARMQRAFSPALAARLFILGERISAGDAFAGGLVSRICPDGAAVDVALEMATLAAGADRSAIASTKGLLHELGDGCADMEHWERVRLSHLDSPTRRQRVAERQAQSR